jgi:hypothetical protein
MDREIIIYTAARIQALEYLVSNLMTFTYANMNLTADDVRKVHAVMLEKAASHTVQGTNSATSDHYAAEFQRALQEMSDRVLATLEAAAQARLAGQRS